jgi:integration host factor subunit alpha
LKVGLKINNNDVDSAVLQEALAADLHRAMLVARVRKEAEKELPTLTKAELAELLFEQVGLNKREAKDMVETFFDEIRNALERGEAVKLSGFGNFQLRDKPQRPGRNPKTGEEIPITARRVVTFHASQKLKAMVEEANPGSPRNPDSPDGPDHPSLARAA